MGEEKQRSVRRKIESGLVRTWTLKQILAVYRLLYMQESRKLHFTFSMFSIGSQISISVASLPCVSLRLLCYV